MRRKSDFERIFSRWVGKQLEIKGFFTKAEVCQEFNLNPDSNKEWMKVYNIILRWRHKSQDRWELIDGEEGINKYGTYKKLWDAFLDMLNDTYNEFLLFSIDNRFYQPARVEKEVIDFLRFRKGTKHQFTILREMDKFEESFEPVIGVPIKPKELKASIENALLELQVYIDAKVSKEIKELTGGKKFGDEAEGE